MVVCVGVFVAVLVGVDVFVGVCVNVFVGVIVFVGVYEGVFVGVEVTDGVGVGLIGIINSLTQLWVSIILTMMSWLS